MDICSVYCSARLVIVPHGVHVTWNMVVGKWAYSHWFKDWWAEPVLSLQVHLGTIHDLWWWMHRGTLTSDIIGIFKKEYHVDYFTGFGDKWGAGDLSVGHPTCIWTLDTGWICLDLDKSIYNPRCMFPPCHVIHIDNVMNNGALLWFDCKITSCTSTDPSKCHALCFMYFN